LIAILVILSTIQLTAVHQAAAASKLDAPERSPISTFHIATFRNPAPFGALTKG
jgi:hypothetical protein